MSSSWIGQQQQRSAMSGGSNGTNPSLVEPLIPKRGDVVPKEGSAEPQQRSVSRNVPLTLVYTFVVFASRSIWSNSVLAAYVYLLKNNNPEAVGFITAIMGISQLLSSFPSGFVADRHRRDILLKAGSVVGLLAMGTTILAAWEETYLWLTIGLAIWGVFWGISSTSLMALFADSIPEGNRSYYFTLRSMLVTSGTTMGPVMALAMFYYMGDDWTVRACAIVLAAGQVLSFPAVLLLCFFRDEIADNDEPETPPSTLSRREDSAETLSLLDDDDDAAETTELIMTDHTTLKNAANDEQSRHNNYFCCSDNKKIPIHVATSDIILGLASGMSIRYFPIFFVKHLHLSPVKVQILYLASPILQVFLMRLAQILSKTYGRCKVTAIAKWTGIALMLVIIISYTFFSAPTWVICVICVFRMAVMNSTGGLTKSFLMDHVPKHQRGKWSALESVNMFSWSGSAAIGGILVGWQGIMFNFCVTAGLQFCGTLPLIRLIQWETLEGSREEQELCGQQQTDREEEYQCYDNVDPLQDCSSSVGTSSADNVNKTDENA